MINICLGLNESCIVPLISIKLHNYFLETYFHFQQGIIKDIIMCQLLSMCNACKTNPFHHHPLWAVFSLLKGPKYAACLLGKSITPHIPQTPNTNCLWRCTQLTHKSEWSVFVPALHKAIKKRSEVAFGGWPLNCTAYHCAVDSASELLQTWWCFLLNSYSLRHLKWTAAHWKSEELGFFLCDLHTYRGLFWLNVW